jgi:WXXGXW repeat (2 copies)
MTPQSPGESAAMRPRCILFATLAVSFLAGCTGLPLTNNPYPQVPELVAEPMSKPPVTSEPLIWQPGHWDWNGSGYIWAHGEYVPAQGHGNLWVPGWWSRTPSGWTWQPAHWVS